MSKKDNGSKKERHYAVEISYSTPMKISGIKIENGEISFLSDGVKPAPQSISFVKFYNKDNGREKKTLKIPLDQATFDVDSLLDTVDIVIAIDTNTGISGEAVSVAIFYLVLKAKDASEYEMNYMGMLTSTFVDTTDVSNELVALNSLLKMISNGQVGYVLKDDKALIIIDHHLGEMERYNSREIPLIKWDETSYLPHNITLAYASTDTQNDSAFNKILAECDKLANELKNNRL